MGSGVAVQIGRSAAESGGMDEHELPPVQLARPGAGDQHERDRAPPRFRLTQNLNLTKKSDLVSVRCD